MPPKRKATEIPPDKDDDNSRSPKKSKSTLAQRQAEARAKAQLYAATLKAKKQGISSPPAASPPPKPKRGRKSTGAYSTSSDGGSLSSPPSRRRRSTGTSTTVARRKGRSAATTAAVAQEDFVFRPPETIVEESTTTREEDVTEGEEEEEEKEDTTTGPNGTPPRSPEYVEKSIRATTPHKPESHEQNESSEKKMRNKSMSPEQREAQKKKKMEQLERARAFGERLMKQKSAALLLSPDAPNLPPDTSQNVTSSNLNSLATSAAAPLPLIQVHATVAAQPPCTTAPLKSSAPPAALANIFAPNKRYIAHRPALLDKDVDSKKFDPNAPFPQRGYKLPTAAYCGCGPTPAYSKTVAAASSVTDVCLTDGVGNALSSALQAGGTYRKRESYSSKLGHMNDELPAVDPPFGSYKRESANNLEPLGVDIDEEEVGALKRHAVDPEPSLLPSRPPVVTVPSPSVSSPSKRPPPTTSIETSTTTANVNQNVLNDSIARARALISSVNDMNRQRRATLGIKSDGVVTNKSDNALVQMLHEQTTKEFLDSREKEEEVAGRRPSPMEHIVVENPASVAAKCDANLVQEEIPINVHVAPQSFIKKMMKSFLFVVIIALMASVAYYITSSFLFFPTTTVFKETKSWSSRSLLGRDKPPEVEVLQHYCFIDHPADSFHLNETIDEQQCAGKYTKCPQWGRCHAGKLQDCEDAGSHFDGLLRFVPNDRRDECIPSKEVLDIIDFVKEVLMSMTVVQHCNFWDKLGKMDVISSEDDSHPLFRIEKVVEKMSNMAEEASILNGTNASLQLLTWLQRVDHSVLRFGSFFGEEEGVIDSIGLASGVSPNSLPVPLMCSLRIMSLELFFFSLGALAYLAKLAWYSISNYTIPSVIVLVLFYIGNLYIKRRRRLEKINTLLEPVLEQVYDRLAVCDNNEGYAALMLRDDIGRDMYPTKLAERAFLFNEVWPRVILEVHSDNRVRKFRKEANGKDLEHWDFHKQPKKGRLLRKSLGGSSQKFDVGAKRESPTVSRDP
ncbi:hypothetical protein ACHAW6_013134 [Cyclotella cf. meneghiniana]